MLHHARRFHHLRQEHFARAKQIADHVHAVHQGVFYHLNRALGGGTRFFGVRFDVSRNAFHQGMGDALLHGLFAPSQVFLLLACHRIAFEALGQFNQMLGGIAAVFGRAHQHHVFDALAQFWLNLFVHFQRTCVDDAHGQAIFNRMV